MKQFLRLAPQHTIQMVRDFHPADRAEDLEFYIDGLRKAGLPE